jgi:glycosyltransferase involved in cell wall biosynthesis
VIGSDRGAIGELVTRIDPGWTVPSGDAGALAQALARAIEAGTALPEERKGAVDDLLAELQPSRVAAAYDELYQRARDAVLQRLSGRS